jgi:hypothetical protein
MRTITLSESGAARERKFGTRGPPRTGYTVSASFSCSSKPLMPPSCIHASHPSACLCAGAEATFPPTPSSTAPTDSASLSSRTASSRTPCTQTPRHFCASSARRVPTRPGDWPPTPVCSCGAAATKSTCRQLSSGHGSATSPPSTPAGPCGHRVRPSRGSPVWTREVCLGLGRIVALCHLLIHFIPDS